MKTKKLTALLMAAVFAVPLVGCSGGEAEFIGEWDSYQISINGDKEDFDIMSIEFKENGEAIYTVDDMSETYDWTIEDGKAIIESDGEKFEFWLEGATLCASIGGCTVYFL